MAICAADDSELVRLRMSANSGTLHLQLGACPVQVGVMGEVFIT